MAQQANAYDTYDNIGIREDLTDVIYNIDPFDTPFMSNIGRGKADNTLHEWQTEGLAAPAQNAQIEGDEATNLALTPTVRVGNYTQISTKTCNIPATVEATTRAGRGREMAHQIAKKGKEMRTDMEFACVGRNGARVAGNATTARELGSVTSWIATNDSFGATGASPTGDGTNARTDGTQRAFTEALLTTVLQSCYTNGGNPNVLMVGAFNKGQVSGFNGNADEVKHNNMDKKVINAVDVYVGDFHTLSVVPNRILRARDALVLQTDMWEIDFLREMKATPLAKTGDSERQMLVAEYTLKAKNEAASGGVFDLTTA